MFLLFQVSLHESTRSYRLKKIEKISLRPPNFNIFEILTCYLKKLEFTPSKNHLAFLTTERHDIEMTNIKISDKNIVPPGGARTPEGGSFLAVI